MLDNGHLFDEDERRYAAQVQLLVKSIARLAWGTFATAVFCTAVWCGFGYAKTAAHKDIIVQCLKTDRPAADCARLAE